MCDEIKPVERTFYCYFRPIALIARLLGVFPVANILTNDSKHLRARANSFAQLYSFCLFAANLFMIWHYSGFLFMNNSIYMSAVVYTMLSRSIVCYLFCVNYSKKLPKLIRLLDSFDRTKNELFPEDNKEKSHIKNLLLWCILPLFLGTAVLSVSFFESMNLITEIVPPFIDKYSIEMTSYFFGILSIWQVEPFLFYIYFSVKIQGNFVKLNNILRKQGCTANFYDTESKSTVHNNAMCKTLEDIRYMHSMTAKSVIVLSKSYGTFMAFDQLCVVLMLVINICAFIIESEHDAHLLTITVVNSFVVVSAVMVSDRIKETGHQVISLLQGIRFSDLQEGCQKQIQMFMIQISANPIEVSAAGFFVVDKRQIPSMLSSVATYLIVLFQYLQQTGNEIPVITNK